MHGDLETCHEMFFSVFRPFGIFSLLVGLWRFDHKQVCLLLATLREGENSDGGGPRTLKVWPVLTVSSVCLIFSFVSGFLEIFLRILVPYCRGWPTRLWLDCRLYKVAGSRPAISLCTLAAAAEHKVPDLPGGSKYDD